MYLKGVLKVKIIKVEVIEIEMPLKEPFIISYTTFDSMPAIIVKVHTDTGIIGFGESVPDEHVTGESVYTVFTALKHHLNTGNYGGGSTKFKRTT